MTAEISPQILFQRVLAGDADAQAEFFAEYGTYVRVITRRWLRGSRLRRQMDSQDLCQTVLLDFVQALRQGRYLNLDKTEAMRVLAAMARNEFLTSYEHHTAARRDSRRLIDEPVDEMPLSDQAPLPEQGIERTELVDAIRSRMTVDERRLFAMRATGESWQAVARASDDSVDGARMRLTRAIRRIAEQLGLME